MKKTIVLLALVLLIGCTRKQEEVRQAAEDNPNVPPPSGPVCRQLPYENNGGIGGPGTSYQYVLIPNFDYSKGDSVTFYYKRWNQIDWSLFREGYYSPITFSVSGSTVTIREEGDIQWDWRFDALIWECN